LRCDVDVCTARVRLEREFFSIRFHDA
jgi:hypothetical protein